MYKMRQKGAWVKGITDLGIEVTVSSLHYKQRAQANGRFVARPLWWVTLVSCWMTTGIGSSLLTWDIQYKRGRPYIKVMIGPVVDKGNGTTVGVMGTIILRKLSPRELRQQEEFSADIAAMRAAVEGYFAKEFGVPVAFAGHLLPPPVSHTYTEPHWLDPLSPEKLVKLYGPTAGFVRPREV